MDFKFSSLSPGGREIERLGRLKAASIDGDAVLLVASARPAEDGARVAVGRLLERLKACLKSSSSPALAVGRLRERLVKACLRSRFESLFKELLVAGARPTRTHARTHAHTARARARVRAQH